ncbi:unnamed protein product [[Actinomadura] parvosata subsp. kistnae]|uniref:hypothetical protein n=1 Tax=[Actinomadura] parvosata TaxID=1955412 RepID=UPI000D2E68DF|nr:unnamed protein product [Actinomadura parvosata subsp. kistnae]
MWNVVGAVVVVWAVCVVVRAVQWVWARVLEALSALAAVAVPVLGVLAVLGALVATVRVGRAVVRHRLRRRARLLASPLPPLPPLPPPDEVVDSRPSPAPATSAAAPARPARTSAERRPESRPVPERDDDAALVRELLSPYRSAPEQPSPDPMDHQAALDVLRAITTTGPPAKSALAEPSLPPALPEPSLPPALPEPTVAPAVPEPAEAAPARTVPITIVLEPHRELDESGRAAEPIGHLRVADTPHVILSSTGTISWTAEYRIKTVEVDVDGLVRHLSGPARDALGDLVHDPGDEAANERFRHALARVCEAPEPEDGRRAYEARPCLDVTAVDCDFVVERAVHDVTARTRHVVASGEISLAGLLLEHPELVRGFAECVSGPADPGQWREFAKDLTRVVRELPAHELLQAVWFPDVVAEIHAAGHELAVKGVALAAVGEDLRIREKVWADPARVELAAVAELTCEDLGVQQPEPADPLPEMEEEPATLEEEPAPLEEEPAPLEEEPAPLEEEPVPEPFEPFWSW